MPIFRLGGLSSGLDTEALMTQLLTLERRPITATQAQQAKIETQRGAWKDILTRVNNLAARAGDLKAGNAGFGTGVAASSNEAAVRAAGGVGAAGGRYNITINNLAHAHSVATDAKAATGLLGIAGTFSISMQVSDSEHLTAHVTLTGSENIDQIRAVIAQAKTGSGAKLPLSATVLRVDGGTARLVLTANQTGARSVMTFTDISGTALAALGIPTQMPGGPGGNTLQVAEDANFTLQGMALQRSTNTITDAIPGVKLELLQDDGTATVSVTPDLGKAVATVKALVEQYNSLAGFIGEKTGYNPELRTGGPLSGNSLPGRILAGFRQAILDPVAGLGPGWQQADSVGLGGIAYNQGNVSGLRQLQLDETKLRQKLEENPQAVADLFNAISERLTAAAANYTQANGLLPNMDREFDQQIKGLKDRMSVFEQRLELRERTLRRQFEALETALRGLQSQQMQIQNQINAMPGWNMGER